MTVRLTPPDRTAVIHYTLDGTEPSPTNGTRYVAPFAVAGKPAEGVVVLRAVTITGGVAAARAAVATYVFPAFVVTQGKAPPGVPAVWGDPARGARKSRPADYEMDPRVISAAERAKALAAAASIPTVSLVMNRDDLWGKEKGLYMNPEASGRAAERRCSVELILPAEPGKGFQVPCGVRVQGGSSPVDWKTPKLSLRLFFRAEYGAGKLVYPLFPGSPVAKFDTLVLDAHLNNVWVHPTEEAQRRRGIYVRDAYASDLQRALGSYGVRHRYVHLYLNGLYWGLYHLHERPDEHFAADHLGGPAAEYDVIKHDRTNLVNGDAKAYDEMFAAARQGLAAPAQYEAFRTHLNIEHFITYMLVNFYLGNTDWDHHNWYAVRRKVGGSGFHFIPWDAEHVLVHLSDDATRTVTQPGSSLSSIGKPRELYLALRQNPAFVARWNARRDELLTRAGGLLTAEKTLPLFNRRIEEVRPSMILESARWGDVARPAMPYGPTDFEAEVRRLTEQYFPQRTQVVRGQLP